MPVANSTGDAKMGGDRCWPGGPHSLWSVATTPFPSPPSAPEFSTKHPLMGSQGAETKMVPSCPLWLCKFSNKL